MPKFSLDEGDIAGHVFPVPPGDPAPGNRLLVVERELKDPATGQTVGTLLAHLTFMKILPNDDALVLGIAEHRLDGGGVRGRKAGVISVQGSFRFSDEHPVFSIVGGTGEYRNARGTVTLDQVAEKFNYDVN